MPRECLKIIESKSKVRQSRAKAVVAKVGTSSSTPAISSDVAELKDMVKVLLLDKKNQSSAPTPSTTPAPVEPNYVTCGGAHSYQNCPATHENAYRDNIQEGNNFNQNRGGNFNQSNFNPSSFNQDQLHRPQVNQAPVYQAPIPQTQRVSQTDFESYVKANDAILRNMQSQGQSTQNQCQNIQNQYQNLQIKMATLTDMMSKFVSANTASSSRPGTLPSNTITNPKEELKGITTQSGVAYQGPKTPSSSKQGTKVTKDQVQTPSSQNTAPVQPSVIQSESQAPVSELVVSPVSAPMPNLKPSIPYPSRRDNEKRQLTPTSMTLELVDRSVSKPIGIAKDVSFKVEVFHFPADFVVVDFEPDPRVPLILRRCFLKTTCEEYSQEVLGFSNVTASGTPTPHNDPIIFATSPTLTPFGDSDFLLFEEADAFLGLEDDPNSLKINPFYYDLEGDILLLEAILNSEPSPRLPNQEQNLPSFKEELKAYEAQTVKSSVDEPPEVERKDLPHHLEYAFLEGDNKLPVIIAKELGKDYKPAVQHQRRVNLKIHDVIKKEVEKLLDAGLIYPISDSPWVSPVHCVPKKGVFTVVENEENELILTRLVTGWRVCINYRKLNEATRKDHFPLPFMDQMLERLAGNEYYCFLEGFSGYFQIPIDPRDQEKTTFTCPYGTFAYRRMPFGLCNASGTFQRCMLAIFHDMVEKTMEVFMDDFSILGNSFENCLSRLDKML
nr:reverse transcriptase domain-containing protein [Tanacetum cinerariifolium]